MTGIGFGFGFGSQPRNAFERLPFLAHYDPARAVTLDGSNNVSALQDLSGNGLNLTQPTSGNRPATSTLNGRTVIQGASGKMLYGSITSTSAPWWFFVAGTWGSGSVEFLFDGLVGSNRSGFGANASSQPVLTHGSLTGSPAGTAPSSGTPFVAAGLFAATEAASRLIVRPNGGTAQDFTTDPDGAAQPFDFLCLGATSIPSNAWTGKIGEFGVVPGTLSESSLQAALTALQLRYGIVTA